MVLSKSKILFVQSLKQKKCRDESEMFLVEGNKIVKELLFSQHAVLQIFATKAWLKLNEKKIKNVDQIIECTESEIERISLQKAPVGVVAIAKQPKTDISIQDYIDNLSLVLDTVQDPGNMGTIIRTADWFGIKHIFCTKETADIYNPKVVQSSMGAILRCNVFYVDLPSFLQLHKDVTDFEIYGAFLDGQNIYSSQLKSKGFLVMGNEGNGISPIIEPFITQRISIPSFAGISGGSESLNVAVATAIICSEFRRMQI